MYQRRLQQLRRSVQERRAHEAQRRLHAAEQHQASQLVVHSHVR